MNHDIATMRAAIAGITALITQRGLVVTQRGIEAYVRKDPKTHKPVLVNIPYLPDNASSELVMAIQGFIDHECGHVLETDYTVWAEVERWANEMQRKGFPGAFGMWNITEDTFIERKMCERFRGTAYNLERMQEFFVAELTGPTFKKALAAGDTAKVFNILLVPMARAWSGQDVFIRYMADKWEHVKGPVAKIGALKDRFPLLSSSRDAFALARELFHVLYVKPAEEAAKPKPAPKPPAPPKPQPPAEEKPKPEPKADQKPEPEADPQDEDQAEPEKPERKEKPKPEPKDEPETAETAETAEGDDDDLEDLDDEGEDDGEAGAGGEDEADEGDGVGQDDEGDGAGANDNLPEDDETSGFDEKGERDPLKPAHRKILRARYDRKLSFEEIAAKARLPVSKIVSLHDQALSVIEANVRAA